MKSTAIEIITIVYSEERDELWKWTSELQTLLMMRTKFLGGLAIADGDRHKVITQKNNKPLGLEKIFDQTVSTV